MINVEINDKSSSRIHIDLFFHNSRPKNITCTEAVELILKLNEKLQEITRIKKEIFLKKIKYDKIEILDIEIYDKFRRELVEFDKQEHINKH